MYKVSKPFVSACHSMCDSRPRGLTLLKCPSVCDSRPCGGVTVVSVCDVQPSSMRHRYITLQKRLCLSATQVKLFYVNTGTCSFPINQCHTVCALLQAEMSYKKNPKFLRQFQYSEREGVPLIVIVGDEEKAKGGIKIRDTNTRQEVRANLWCCVKVCSLLYTLLGSCRTLWNLRNSFLN